MREPYSYCNGKEIMMLLSGCIIAKNEEKIIGGCIDNLMQVCDEVIVVDNGSEDSTKSVAQKHGAKVFSETERIRDQAKNTCLEKAQGEWIVMLDADERFDDVYIHHIRDVVKELGNTQTMGLTLPRFEYHGNGMWAAIRILRIIKNDTRIRFNDYIIHNSPGPAIRSIGGKIDHCYIPIHHIDALIKGRSAGKRDKYIEIIEAQIKQYKDSKDVYLGALYNYLGVEHTAEGRYDVANECFENALKAEKDYPGYHDLTFLYFAFNEICRHNYKAAEEYATQLVKEESMLSDRAYGILASIALAKNDHPKAKEICRRSIQINKRQPHQFVNLAYLSENEEEKHAYLKRAMEMNPYLLNDTIYQKTCGLNIYAHQTSFVSQDMDIKDMVQKVKGINFNCV